MDLRIEQLSESNFKDYEALTSCQGVGGCYCAFWHQKITSMAEWEARQKEDPLLNRESVLIKVRTGYHVGVLAYSGEDLAAWISVGPLTDFYWTWKRVAKLGEGSKNIAGIMCFTMAQKFRGKGLQAKILNELKVYAKEKGWKVIEAYPFDANAIEKYKDDVIWPGMAKGYAAAGFERIDSHWLSSEDAGRSIYRVEV